MKISLHNCDCLEYMKSLPDNHFDITIADPPYGIGRDWEKRNWRSRVKYKDCAYMNTKPTPEYFEEIMRVSKEWIIWGWNYFTDILPPTNYLIIWDKMSNNNPVFKYSKCEIAGTSIKIPCNIVSIGWDGYRMGEETGTKKIHPHQKPIALYRWLLDNYAKYKESVFDPFAGSAALGIACIDKFVSYTGCEVEKTFFDASFDRLEERCRMSRAQLERNGISYPVHINR